jgi:hypothetical protein
MYVCVYACASRRLERAGSVYLSTYTYTYHTYIHTHTQVLLCCDKALDAQAVQTNMFRDLPCFLSSGEIVHVVTVLTKGVRADAYHMLLRTVNMQTAVDRFKAGKAAAPVCMNACYYYSSVCVYVYTYIYSNIYTYIVYICM